MAAKVHKARVFEGHKCTTGIHNALLDVVMPELSATTWKILCVLIRQTTGWDREEQGASYQTLMTGTGIKSRATIAACLRELEDYRYPLISIQPGRQHEESKYTVNRDVEIDWIPQNFAYASSSKNEPLSSSKNEPLSSSKNEPLKQSSSSKNELSYMKESINLKEREKETDSLSELLCELHGIGDKAGWQLKDKFQSLAIELAGLDANPDQVREFWLSRTKKPSLNYFAGDFTTWRAGRYAPVNNSQAKAVVAPEDYAAFYKTEVVNG